MIYKAQETFLGEKTVKSDIWSAGVVLYRMLFRKYPFFSNERNKFIEEDELIIP